MKHLNIKIAAIAVLGLGIGAIASCGAPAQADKPTSPISFDTACDYSTINGINLVQQSSVKSLSKFNLVNIQRANDEVVAPTESEPTDTTPEVAPDAPTSDEEIPSNPDASETPTETPVEPAEPVAPKDPIIPEDQTGLSIELKKDIVKNIEFAQQTLAGEVIKSEVKESDKEGFESSYTISTSDITGESHLYSFYYTETVVEGDDDIHMDGIVNVDGTEYKVQGEKDTDEGEEEFEFTIIIDELNYVTVEHEISALEQEFEYTTVTNGEVVMEKSVSFETSKDGNMALSFETETADSEIEYSFEFIENNEGKFVEVEIENNDQELEVLVKISQDSEGTMVYEFLKAEQENEEAEKDSKDEEDDEEDK